VTDTCERGRIVGACNSLSGAWRSNDGTAGVSIDADGDREQGEIERDKLRLQRKANLASKNLI
jgi:hypothetical protein